LIVYRLNEGFTPSLASHGNAKEQKPYHPTLPSTITRIKDECSLSTGLKATPGKVSSEMGGVLGASVPGQLPRNEKQIDNHRRMKKTPAVSGNAPADELFVVMQAAHTQDPKKKFVRDIKTAPEPAVVIADDQQLHDMVRFCTSSFKFGIVTIDPTFTLGDFDVTPITYRHLLLETRRGKQPPIFLGPVLVHYKKTFATYLFFASSIIGQCPQLQGVLSFGTDGERALIDAFRHEFSFSQHLTCFIHVQRNIKEKLNTSSIPCDVARLVLDDIFGRKLGTVYEESLVDASDVDDFQAKVESLLSKWRNHDMSSSADMEGFIQWFVANKVDVIKNSMLRPIREDCGLGNPPNIFTTNPSESMNALLKRKVDFKRSELPLFIEKIKEVVTEQQKEVERAIINRGKYQFQTDYRYLQVAESEWFTMNSQQRVKHINKVQSVSVIDVEESLDAQRPCNPSMNTLPNSSTMLSVDVDIAAQGMSVPLPAMEGIWRKAKDLLSDTKCMSPAPGQSSQARMVLSFGGKVPHMVIPTQGGGFNCDSNCPNWKSLCLCSHTVAVAEANGKLAEFIAFVRKKKRVPNVTKLVTSSMPRGRGRKGGVTPRTRKRAPATTSRVPMSIDVQGPVEHSQGLQATSSDVSFATVNMVNSPFYSPSGYHYPIPPGYSAFPPYSYPYQTPDTFSRPTSPYFVCFIKGHVLVVIIGTPNRRPRPMICA
jgi:hypothetical protein